MGTDLFVFNIPVEKAVLITLRTLQYYYHTLLLLSVYMLTKYKESEKKKPPVRTRRACIKIQTAKNIIKLQDVQNISMEVIIYNGEKLTL